MEYWSILPNISVKPHTLKTIQFYFSRFSVGKLPIWAKKQLVGAPGSGNQPGNSDAMPKGRWAARIGGQVTVKSHYDSDSVIPFPAVTNNKENKNSTSNANNNNSEHDADIDEYSDGLLTMGKSYFMGNYCEVVDREKYFQTSLALVATRWKYCTFRPARPSV